MDVPQSQPESSGNNPEISGEQNVYELTPEKTEEQKIIEKISPAESKSAPGPSPIPDKKDGEKDTIDNLIEKVESGLKIKKKPEDTEEDGQPKTPDTVWVERVKKVIRLFKREPYTEQQKAQKLGEAYLSEHEVNLKNNGDRK